MSCHNYLVIAVCPSVEYGLAMLDIAGFFHLLCVPCDALGRHTLVIGIEMRRDIYLICGVMWG